MNAAFTWSLYGIAAVLLAVSFIKDRGKTARSLKKAWNMFINVLPQFVAILLLTGLLLAIVTPAVIQHVIGMDSGFFGILFASLLGSVALVPALIAFPIAAELLNNGAGIPQIAVFISTLTTVGFVTLPVEIKYLGRKTAILRTVFAYLFAFITAFITGAILL